MFPGTFNCTAPLIGPVLEHKPVTTPAEKTSLSSETDELMVDGLVFLLFRIYFFKKNCGIS